MKNAERGANSALWLPSVIVEAIASNNSRSRKELSMVTSCAYCRKKPPIQNSHILPKWTIRLAQEESVTGKLRATDNINHRLQDVEKVPLLCLDCENFFSKLEGKAKEQFVAGTIKHDGKYNDDFFRFLVSVLWRVGIVRSDQIKTDTRRFSAALTDAVKTWDQFIRGLKKHLF